MSTYRITQFDPSTAKRNSVWLLIGARNTGKTVLLVDLLYNTRNNYDFAMAMTATMSTVEILREHIPDRLIFKTGYDFDAGDKFKETCSLIRSDSKTRYSCLAQDDCMFDNKVMKTETQRYLYLNSRHDNVTLFNTTQYCMLIPSHIRTQVDFIFALRENIMANKKRLYEYFFGMFPTFSEFDKVFSECTKNFGAFVLDKTKATPTVHWYIANPRTPKFKLGKPVFWKMSQYIDDVDRVENKKQNKTDSNIKYV